MSKRSTTRSMSSLAGTVLLTAVIFISFLGGKITPSPAMASDPTPSSWVYLPVVFKNFPLQTVFGVEMSKITAVGGLNEVVNAGTNWVRRNGVLWSEVEPVKGERNWEVLVELEEELQNASGQGIHVVLIIRSTPSWARMENDSYCGPIKSEELNAFADFMRDLVARYSVAPYEVKYWEIWNEPDAPFGQGDPPYGCWGNEDDEFFGGGYYGEMLKVVYPEIKTAAPDAQVLIGGLLLDCDPDVLGEITCKSAKFLEGVLAAGAGPYFDGVSYHAYDYYCGSLGQYGNPNWGSAWDSTGPVAIDKAEFIQDVLNNYGIIDKFIMNTESAIVCVEAGDVPGDSVCESDPESDFEQTKASYVAQVYAAALSKDLLANVWFSVFGWRHSGLLNDDLSPRPAYTAYQFSRQELRDADFLAEVSSVDLGGELGVKGYKFDRGDHKIWVLWSQDGDIHTIDLSSIPLAAWNMMGEAIAIDSVMEVTIEPIYLEWSP